MNNNISNPKTEVPTGMSLNDKDIITALLTCLKEMEKNYVLKCSLEVFDEICYKNTGMNLQEILNDIGLSEQQESEKFGSDLRQAIFGTTTPRETK